MTLLRHYSFARTKCSVNRKAIYFIENWHICYVKHYICIKLLLDKSKKLKTVYRKLKYISNCIHVSQNLLIDISEYAYICLLFMIFLTLSYFHQFLALWITILEYVRFMKTLINSSLYGFESSLWSLDW